MTILQEIVRSLCASFPANCKGQRRAAWFVFAIFAIAMPFVSSRTSDILRCLEHLFGIRSPQRQFYRFMGSPKLPWKSMWQKIWRFIPNPTTGQRLVLALDDFINPKSGELVYGCHHFFDHAAKQNQCKYPWAQNIVSIGLLKRIKNRWACLPLAARFYHLRKDLEACPVRFGKSFVKFQSKLDQAVEMITEIGGAFANENLLVVCDSWFGNFGLWKPLRDAFGDRCHLLTRLRCNITIFATTPAPTGKPGRPRKYGSRLGNASSLAAVYRDQAQPYDVPLYGKLRRILAFDQLVMLKTLRCQVRIVWVFNRSRWVALCTTDLNLSVEEIVELYGARWKIEAGFKELKQEIGSSFTQARNPFSVNNHLQLCMLTTTIIWIHTDHLAFTPRRRHAVRGRRHFAFSDGRRAFVDAAVAADFSWLSPSLGKRRQFRLVSRLLRLAA